MRENRPYGSEGGGAELNRPSLPLSFVDHCFARSASIAFWISGLTVILQLRSAA
jgi:hypothetical protein